MYSTPKRVMEPEGTFWTRAIRTGRKMFPPPEEKRRIRADCWLQAGKKVRITNMMGRRSYNFRVVGPVSPVSEQGGEYGVEYLYPGRVLLRQREEMSTGPGDDVNLPP